jgi:hypothetical protein
LVPNITRLVRKRNAQGVGVMDLLVEHVDVWAASIQDKPGALATVLAELRESGADLQFIIARRAPEAPGKGVVFVTPLQGDREIAAAAQLGFNVTRTVHSVRVMGPDRRGIAAELTRKLADKGINLRGFSASVIGTQFVAYVAPGKGLMAGAAIKKIKRGCKALRVRKL